MRLFNWLKNWRKKEEMVVGANCGLCGKWMDDELVPLAWPWSICGACIRGGSKI